MTCAGQVSDDQQKARQYVVWLSAELQLTFNWGLGLRLCVSWLELSRVNGVTAESIRMWKPGVGRCLDGQVREEVLEDQVWDTWDQWLDLRCSGVVLTWVDLNNRKLFDQKWFELLLTSGLMSSMARFGWRVLETTVEDRCRNQNLSQ